MRKRAILKRIVIVLSVFLCAEVCFFVYQITSGGNSYARNLDLGNKYLLSEDYDSAIRAFSKAIDIDEKKEDAYIGRGDAYKAKGDYASAWEDYEKAEELSGDTNLLREKIGETKITVVSENGEGVAEAAIKLDGSTHSYEFSTDSTGHIAEVIFPEIYRVEVIKDDYEPIETELSAEKGGSIVDQIEMVSSVNGERQQKNDDTTVSLKSFIEQKDFMYGKSYTYTNFARTEYYPEGGEQWEGISENQLLGYCIDDFDNDGVDELLLVRSEGGYLQLEMYEVENGEVVLVDTKFMESDSRYGAVPLLHAESSTGDVGTRNGVLCCLVQKSSHRIFLQNSDTVWKMGGNEIFIVSTIYKDNQFSDYNVIHTIGTAIELPGTGTDEYDQQLKDLGVPDPDFSSMFYKFEPLINCFDGDARIVLMAEQHLVDEHKENGTTIKVISETTFEKMESAEEYDGAQTGVKPEAESNSFTYKVYNDFFREGYKSVTEYRPEEWALVELDDDGIPEILFKENSVNRGATFEIYYYNDQSGTVESAGSFYEEYYEAVRYNSQKHLLSTDGSMAGLQSWDGYSYDDHEIDWAFTLSASTDPGSSPRTYTVEGTDETGTNVLGNYEMDGVDRIWDEYFGEQTEITFQTFFTGVNWNLPEGHGEHGE